MSTRQFIDAFLEIAQKSSADGPVKEAMSAVARRALKNAQEREERIKVVKEDRERGARATKHRISI